MSISVHGTLRPQPPTMSDISPIVSAHRTVARRRNEDVQPQGASRRGRQHSDVACRPAIERVIRTRAYIWSRIAFFGLSSFLSFVYYVRTTVLTEPYFRGG